MTYFHVLMKYIFLQKVSTKDEAEFPFELISCFGCMMERAKTKKALGYQTVERKR